MTQQQEPESDFDFVRWTRLWHCVFVVRGGEVTTVCGIRKPLNDMRRSLIKPEPGLFCANCSRSITQ